MLLILISKNYFYTIDIDYQENYLQDGENYHIIKQDNQYYNKWIEKQIMKYYKCKKNMKI